jgi:hypothetical protein
MKYVYMDESIDGCKNTACLMALEIDSNDLNNVISDYYKIVEEIVTQIYPEPGVSEVIHPYPALHGSNFLRNDEGEDLPNIDDEFRLKILSRIVKLVNGHKIELIRFGYSNYLEIKKCFLNDLNCYSLNWLSLTRYINEKAENNEYVFIMDGSDRHMVNTMSGFLASSRRLHHSKEFLKESLILGNIKNFHNNVSYVDDKYCEMIQIVDVIGYLLLKRDMVEIDLNKLTFSMKLANLAKEINPAILFDKVSELNIS